MGATSKGKEAVLTKVFSGKSLALGNLSEDGGTFTEISSVNNKGYKRMQLSVVTEPPEKPSENHMYLTVSNGVISNCLTAYFADADDGVTADSLDPTAEGGWEEAVSAIAVLNGDSIIYANKFTDDPVRVYQAHRIKIGKGNFSFTFNLVPSESRYSESLYEV